MHLNFAFKRVEEALSPLQVALRAAATVGRRQRIEAAQWGDCGLEPMAHVQDTVCRIRPHELRALCVGSQLSRAGRRRPGQLQYGTPRGLPASASWRARAWPGGRTCNRQ